MESTGLGIAPGNNVFNLFPLRNDDFGMRQFLYPSTTFSFPPGDFNRNGTVDAADYVTWREGLGTKFVESDNEFWRQGFGSSSPRATAVPHGEAVPEPPSLVKLVAIVAAVATCARRQA
jgi:hypothetical protein